MPLTKEKMKEYMRDRRAQQRERGEKESQLRANTVPKLDCIGVPENAMAGKTAEPILPVPVLAEPQQADSRMPVKRQDDGGEARESMNQLHSATSRKAVALPNLDSRGGEKSFLNQTDQAFEDKKPGYYIFEKEVLTKPCWYCNKTFQTKLQLNKFCCPEHKENWLKASLRRGA